jgi:serine phosphatase RsbU (regulator of sigma subunit)
VVSFLRGVRNITSPLLRRNMRFVLPGTALGILPPLLLAGLLALFPSLEIPGDRYAFITLVLVPLSFGHAIIRYGLLDLELVVKRSVVFAALTALLIIGYWLVAELVADLVGRNGTQHTIVSFAVVGALALLFVPVRERVQALVERSLYGRQFDYRRTVREFSSLFATFLERDELVRILVERVPEVVGAGRAVLFLRTSRDEALRLGASPGFGPGEIPLPLFYPSNELLRWWAEFDGPVVVGSPGRHPDRFDRLPAEERQLLEALDPRVLVFLPRERTLEGLLLLGRKPDGERYRAEDLELLATLGDQAGTALSSSRLHEEALERRRLEEELAVARRIQASLLPASVPEADGLEIAAVTRPCLEVGGDFYDFLDLGDEALGLAVADVSGKGVPAALILSGLQATLRGEASAQSAPEPVVAKINARLCADVESGNFASLLYGHLDLRRRSFRYVNAGHPAGLVVRRDGSLRRLETGGLLLGVERTAEYAAGEHRFEEGELLVLYSDGVTDVLNEADEEFGQERLESLLPRLAHLPSRAVIDGIVAAVERFVGGTLPDDLTLLVAKFRPAGLPGPPA